MPLTLETHQHLTSFSIAFLSFHTLRRGTDHEPLSASPLVPLRGGVVPLSGVAKVDSSK
jgi:hypothetical protein